MRTRNAELSIKLILEGAAKSIASVGLEKTSITEIAKRANLSRSLVAYHFPQKSEILWHVLSYISDQLRSEIDKIDSTKAPKAVILQIIQTNLKFFLKHPHYFKCLFLRYYFASIDKRYRDLNSAVTARAIARFEFQLDRASAASANPLPQYVTDGLAEALHSELVGAIQKFYVVNHEFRTTAYAAKVMNSFESRLDDYGIG